MKSIRYLILTIISLFTISIAFADFKVYVQSKLGTDKSVYEIWGQLLTDDGTDLLPNLDFVLIDPALQNNDNLLLGSVASDELVLKNFQYIYQCEPDNQSIDCWDSSVDGISLPTQFMYCDLQGRGNGDIIINTADQSLGVSNQQIAYETKNVRIILNKDFTITYRVIRKSDDGHIARDEKNVSVLNARHRCQFAS